VARCLRAPRDRWRCRRAPGLHVMRCLLILVKEARVDSHVLLDPLTHLNAEAELLEQVAQSVAVDQLNGRGAITGGFCLASRVNDPVVINKPFSPRPAIAPRKSLTTPGVTVPLYRLHWK